MNDACPDLQRLFDEAPPLPPDGQFVATVLRNIQRARRRRLIGRLLTAALATSAAALTAPYIAQLTLDTTNWLISDTGLALTCLCATLMTWRITRRALS